MDALWQRRKVEATTYFENLMYKLKELDGVFRTRVKNEPKVNNDLFFCDGIREIDFVFVYKRSNKEKVKMIVNNYIKNLEKEGVQFEAGAKSHLHPDLLFIKVHVVRSRLLMCSVLLNYEPSFMCIPDAPLVETRIINLPFMYTELTRKEPLSDVVQRASESALGARPKDLTSAERVMITAELLKNVNFGNKQFETGLGYMLENKYLEAAFPLHEQPSVWRNTGALNDRQLLMKYWSSYKMIFKYQPLDLIHKYYGAEVAFYFAFVGFYNRMLIPVAFLGALAIAFGALTYDSDRNAFSKSFCKSKQIYCPPCQDKRFCDFRPVVEDCANTKFHYVIDNTVSMVYAIAMCFWATTVAELWKRHESILRYKWNLLTLEQDTQSRPQYRKKARHKRLNKYTGKYDYYIPQRVHILKLFISYICCGCLAMVVVISVIAACVLRLSIVYLINEIGHGIIENHIEMISHGVTTTTLFIFMTIYDSFYKYVATKLTDFETPRTQAQYDRSFVYKLHLLSMFNAYAYLYYTAFFKGAFRTYPGDMKQYESIGILNYDVDEALGSLLPLSFQLVFILSMKTFVKMSWQIVGPYMKVRFRQRKAYKRIKNKNHVCHSWERGYHRNKTGYYDVTVNEYKTIVMQYGFLILFPSAYPLGPIIAFFTNLFEIRIDAYKLTKWNRRPIPTRVHGIGAWSSILSTMSYIGIITNCFLIAFTTNFTFYAKAYFVEEEIDAINATFSVFAVKDYPTSSVFYDTPNIAYCLYKSRRFPPDHPRKYQHDQIYWQNLSYQLLIVIVLEGLVLGFNKLLSYAISDMPFNIKERIRLRRKRENAAREKRLNERFQAEQHTRFSITREQIATRLLQMQRNT